MSRHSLTLALAIVATSALPAQTPVQKSALHDFRVVTVADGLVNPWSIAFLPDGDMLITERPGRLRIVRGGKLLEKPVEGVPPVLARNQGGLFDVVPHPQFATNRLLYLAFAKPTGEGGGATTAVVRGRFENDRLTNLEEVFVADTRGAPGHFGGRLAFDGRGYLFVSVGERMAPSTGNLEAHPAQDLSNHHGTINRIHDDGRVPTDNPFTQRDGARPEIWSYGHRNPQALMVHPVTGDVWATEHGPQGGDELNLIRPGMNYGWPVIGFGVNYRSGTAIHSGTHREGMEQPALVWIPSIAVSGMTLYTGDKFPEWKGSLFVGGLAGERLDRITLDGQRAERAEMMVRRQGRIRDVRQGPDGFIYIAFEHRQGEPTAVVRLEPVARR